MERTLRRAGFNTVARASFSQGQFCPPIALDDKKYEWESLYVEAVKS
jgi:hypothetical protein